MAFGYCLGTFSAIDRIEEVGSAPAARTGQYWRRPDGAEERGQHIRAHAVASPLSLSGVRITQTVVLPSPGTDSMSPDSVAAWRALVQE